MTSSDDKSIPLPPPEAKRPLSGGQSPVWVAAYCKFLSAQCTELELPVRATETAPRLPLKSVYTPLHGTIGPDARSPKDVRTPLIKIVEATPAVILIGESGMGKSTFLKYLAAHYVKAGAPVPLLLELADLDVIGPSVRASTGTLPWDILSRCLVRYLDNIGIKVSLEAVNEYIERSDVAWLLDGFHEISSNSIRKELANVIRRDRMLWPRAKFVVTATEVVVRDGTAPIAGEFGLDEVIIDKFRPEDVGAFFDRFLEALRPTLREAERKSCWEPVARSVHSVPELEDLLTSPLNLTAIALLHLTGARDPMETELPAVRGELLEAIIHWAVRRLSLGIGAVQPVDALAPLGYAMLSAAPGPLTKCGISDASRWVSEGEPFRGAEDRAERFLSDVAASGLVLRRAGPGDLKLQESFRDYLAARYLVRKRHLIDWKSVLATRLDDPNWRLTVHLVAGELLGRGTTEVNDFFAWLAGLSYPLPLEQRLKRVALGGSVLRELKAGGYTLPDDSPWRNLVLTIAELFRRPLPWIPLRVRYEAGVAFGMSGDNRLEDFHSTWTTMPGGRIWFGAQGKDPSKPNYDTLAAQWEGPVHEFELPEYAIRVYPVTVAEYASFVMAGGYEQGLQHIWDAAALGWLTSEGIDSPRDWGAQLLYPNTPITGICWYEARAYCRWLSVSRADGYEYRLPTEHEWEFAARRGIRPGSIFPWGMAPAFGDEAEANWAGAGLRRKTPVGLFPRSATLDGVADMYGNVEEWCLDTWADFERSTQMNWDELLDPKHTDDISAFRIAKGGSCIRFSRLMRPSYRSRILAISRYHTVGFRPIRVACEHGPFTGDAIRRKEENHDHPEQ